MQILDCDDANSVVGVGNGGAGGLGDPSQPGPDQQALTTSTGPIRVVLVDNDREYHHVFTLLLEAISRGTIRVVGAAASTKELLASVDHWQPQVVLMDNHLGDGVDGIEATRRVLVQQPGLAVVIHCARPFSPEEAEELARQAYQAGAVAVVYKQETRSGRLVETIKRAVAGQEDSLATLFADVGAPDQL